MIPQFKAQTRLYLPATHVTTYRNLCCSTRLRRNASQSVISPNPSLSTIGRNRSCSRSMVPWRHLPCRACRAGEQVPPRGTCGSRNSRLLIIRRCILPVLVPCVGEKSRKTSLAIVGNRFLLPKSLREEDAHHSWWWWSSSLSSSAKRAAR